MKDRGGKINHSTIIASPLEGEADFQCEQEAANIRKSGEGSLNLNQNFTPHPFFRHSFLGPKNIPLPQGARGKSKIKKVFILIFLSCVFLFYGRGCAFGASAPIKPITSAPAQTQLSPVIAQPVDFNNCTKYFKMSSQKLYYLTLAGIGANRFTINEMQSKSGYILFTAAQKQFLATIIGIDSQNALLKITPYNNEYFFPVGIVQNMFKYIELNTNTVIEKLTVS